MYPNPQDALPLPAGAGLQQYRERAAELARACLAGEAAIRSWAAHWVDTHLELEPEASEPGRREAKRRARQIADFARDRLTHAGCAESEAELVIARAYGFASWRELVRHIEALSDAGSEISAFERAADAIVAGGLAALERLLASNPDLIRARSSREHRATLLHYVSANGVEGYRQKTPPNVVAIARRLLDAGAEVDAEADVYGGGSTTLGLVLTSTPPREAGVQRDLANLLLERGARVDAGIVRSCLMNGCPEAAAHVAEHGAAVDLEEAAGIGRLDLVARCFEDSVSGADAAAALIMAAWYDRREVVEFLLDRGVDVGAPASEGQTALHVAAYQGNSELVELLLKRGAPTNVKDTVHGTSPLVWALHAWLVERRAQEESYRTVVRMLVDAGALVNREWLDDDRLRADPALYAALSARASPSC